MMTCKNGLRILEFFNFYDGELDGFVKIDSRDGLGYFETIWWSGNQQVRLYRIHFATTETLGRVGMLQKHVQLLQLKGMEEPDRQLVRKTARSEPRGQYFRAAKRIKRNSDEVNYALGRNVETSYLVSGKSGR